MTKDKSKTKKKDSKNATVTYGNKSYRKAQSVKIDKDGNITMSKYQLRQLINSVHAGHTISKARPSVEIKKKRANPYGHSIRTKVKKNKVKRASGKKKSTKAKKQKRYKNGKKKGQFKR